MRKTEALTLSVVLIAMAMAPGTRALAVRRDSSDATPLRVVQSAGGEYENLEAVLETARGSIVIEFFPKDAPKHVEYFVKQARAGAYDGTLFHRMFKNGLIQGGDPLTRNPAPAARAKYGTGGLNAGLPDEVNKNKHIGGAVSAAMMLNPANANDVKPGTSGAQFFIVVAPQPMLDAKFTVFGRVIEGMDVAAAISNAPANAQNLATDRIEIKRVTIRDKAPSVDQMKAMKGTIETSVGTLKIELLADGAPNSAREFVRYVKAGIYDGATFYRVSAKYYMEVGYLDTWPPDSPNRKRYISLWSIPAEKSNALHVRGVLSMRIGQDGTTNWYFFTISKDNPALDGKGVIFAKVVEGLEILDKIAETELDGDKPKDRIEIKKITLQ
jgi:cyclophilin family peptidyl-prolyl cis-trans isomerase